MKVENMKEANMKEGNIYYVSYSGSELVFRLKKVNTVDVSYFTALHQWNGFEQYNIDNAFVNSGIKELREATQTEKHALFRYEVAKGF